MRKLALLALAAAAAMISTGALAQVVTSPGPVSGGTGGFHGGTMQGRTSFHGGMFPHRLQPGFVVPPMWFGPQFHVANWQTYGFSPPPAGHRWVRYYDDAYLVDQQGRVVDTRAGLDWDRYGERWNMQNGIPAYHGSNDFQPGPEDYAWVERNRGQYAQAPVGGPPGVVTYGGAPGATTTVYGAPAGGCQGGPSPCGGYGYGYGYGVVAYPIVIETTVVTGGCGCCCTTEEVVEEVVEYERVYRPRPRRPVRRYHRPAPPPPGERG
jgi:hypothetical protein